MITHCPHCNRAVSNSEPIARVNGTWFPTSCLNGESAPHQHDEQSEVITNHLYFYCSVTDAGRTGLIAGPYSTYEQAQQAKRSAREQAEQANSFACFYAYGIASSNEQRKTVFGVL